MFVRGRPGGRRGHSGLFGSFWFAQGSTVSFGFIRTRPGGLFVHSGFLRVRPGDSRVHSGSLG